MKWMLFSIVLPAILLTSPRTPAQTLPPEITSRVDQVFERWNKPDSPGCALGVYKDGEIIYKRGYGMANLNDDIPITSATVFHVASMSKQFTAASIILLAQQGKLSLDDDVHKYIPELPDFHEKITIRELMHHTSGLRDQWLLLDFAGWRYSKDLITDDDVMSVVTRQKALNFKPGERFMYSNTGYTLLAIIVKRVSGMSLREFTTINIFAPLGMTHTHFRDDHEEIIKHDALGYEQDGSGEPFRMDLTNFDTVGATSLHTTVEDLQLWDENFYHPRIGGPAFIAQMLEPGTLNSGEQMDYASGLGLIKYKGLPTVDHGGADAGYRSDLTRFPEQHFSVAVLCNLASTNPGALVRQVADVFLAKDLKASETTPAGEPANGIATAPTAEQMEAMAGTYWNRDNNSFEKIWVKDGQLNWSEFKSDQVVLMKPAAEAHFHLAGVPGGDDVDIHFVAATAAVTRHLELIHSDGKLDVFESVTAFEPTSTQLAEYAGQYFSEEIDPVYRVVLQDNVLSMLRLKHKPDLLRPVMRDTFVGEIGTLQFTRDPNQQISGFILSNGQTQGFRFTKKPD
jgi:CubicO group peptidase (beta-lactamase class C family)